MTAKSLLTWATGKEWKEVVTMVSSENCCVTLPIVPDITAVSYQKSIPPMAEATERKMMYPVLVPACPDDVMMLFNFIFNGNKNNENSY